MDARRVRRVLALAIALLGGALPYVACAGHTPDSNPPKPIASSSASAGASAPTGKEPTPPPAASATTDTKSPAADAGKTGADRFPDSCHRDNYCENVLDSDSVGKAYCSWGCDCEGIYCIDVRGSPLDNDVLPDMSPGQRLVVRVLGTRAQADGRKLVLSEDGDPSVTSVTYSDLDGGAPADAAKASEGADAAGVNVLYALQASWFASADASIAEAGATPPASSDPPAAQPDAGSQSDASTHTGTDYVVLVSRDILVPDSAAASSTYTFRYSSVSATNSSQVFDQTNFNVRIKQGDHFLEVGLLIPFVLNGDREITGAPIPNTGLQSIEVKEDLHVTFGIAVNVYPFSVPGRNTTPFNHDWNWWEVYRYIGLQAGTTLDFTSASFREWYLGVGLRLLQGVSVNSGVAMLRGQFLPNGVVEGMLVPTGGTLPQDTKYMFRPYIGLTLSTDILGTISQVFTAVSNASAAKTTPLAVHAPN